MGTLGELVARTVREHPWSPALEYGGSALTYHELWELSGVLRRLVDSLGHSGRPIGICSTRRAFSYAAYLAALRSGSPAVPLHPAFPAERLRMLLAAAGAEFVLLEEDAPARLADRLAAAGAQLGGGGEAPGGVRSPTDSFAAPDDVAYILFTSGSTGTPKGVPISHRCAHAYITYSIDRYCVGPGSRLSHTFDLTFDPSVFDVFTAWGSGATLVVPAGNELVTPARHVRDRGLSHWFSVPTVVSLASNLRDLRPGSMPELRWSLFIGDQLTLGQALAWHEAAPASFIENVYGPTELTVACAGYQLPTSPADWPETSNGTVPIGQIYPHLEHVVIDAAGQPADEGELCVRGVQRFAGYLDDTRNRDAFVSYAGDRAVAYRGEEPLTPRHWYRTGDRVRRESGEFVHLGRRDEQLQVNGCRVEPGEIEAALRRNPAVVDAVVIADSGTQTLTAFCTGSTVDARELRQFLRDRLPDFMVPQRIRWLERLPISPNGKVLREQLWAEASRPASEAPPAQRAAHAASEA